MLFEIISDNVDFMFTDVHEIGSSDVSICVNRIIKEYAPFTEDYASTPTRQVIRRCVLNCLHVLEDLPWSVLAVLMLYGGAYLANTGAVLFGKIGRAHV